MTSFLYAPSPMSTNTIRAQRFGCLQQHIHVLGQADVAAVGDVELLLVQSVAFGQPVRLPLHGNYSLLVDPVVDDLDLLFRNAFGEEVAFEVVGDDDDAVGVAVGEVFDPPSDVPDQAA